MNYYSFYDPDTEVDDVYYNGGLESDACCGGMEVVLQNLTGLDPVGMVKAAIEGAMEENVTLLAWNILPQEKPYYKEVEKLIRLLPATKCIARYKNKRTGRMIHAYVTNLQQEWV